MALPAERLHRDAQALAAPLPPLLVEAERVAATVMQGLHGRRRSGAGDSFWQFRRYQAGDPSTAIDWRQSAKSDPLYVRETEWAAAQSAWLWADPSPSMRWSGAAGRETKHHRAAVLALALASLLSRGGERVGLLGDAEPPAMGRAVLLRLAASLAAAEAPPVLPDIHLSRHSHVVLLSDFLQPLPQLEAMLRGAAAAGLRGHLVQVLDPAEESLPYEGRMRFIGLEGEGDLLVPGVEGLREDYRRRLLAQRAALQDLARLLGWSFMLHHTDTPARAALLGLHGALGGV